ncbi:MAG TPA: beta-ketoacyl synthase N-terminal-like domain-containing protein, partial [Bradyrhizobium sp.]|nr:beta-ketoacyl synthase N-terminal-like domain-containing protein [Bradyrhizobium sp.]
MKRAAVDGSAGRPGGYRVVLEGPGDIDTVRVEETPVADLADNQVRIAVRAFSLNFGDLLCVRGLYPTMPPYPFTPGFEVSGVVTALGKAVRSVRVGDAVFALTGESLGGHATVVNCPEQWVIRKPAALSYEEACALPVVAITMIDVFDKAKLRKGEKILIQTAAGGTGLIAVQLAKHHGAEIFCTAGSARKLDYLKNLGVDHVINYREADFEEEVRRLTKGSGVDVVINTLSGDAIQKGMRSLSAGGRYIEVAMTALRSAKSIDLSVLGDNQSFYSVDLRRMGLKNKSALADYKNKLLSLIERGTIRPTIHDIFSFDRVADAYACMSKRENIGKIVVAIPEEYRFSEAHAVSLQGTRRREGREPIAVIGMSGRFARSPNVDALWEHLAEGTDLVEEVSRWDLSRHSADQAFCRSGSLLQDIDRFDPEFFNISSLEATYMDPQQRLFLEEAWTALEDAGYAGAGVEGRSCGVYVGCVPGDYFQLFGESSPAHAFWGNAGSVIPARIAYHLNMQGPAVAVDTACSSSLVAIHMACQGLWSGETDMALAGGVFVLSTPQFYLFANRAAMLSPAGRCHAFDERADGFVPGEGVGVVVLKRLSDALADGDHIDGVLAGSALNQDGASNGITAPSALSQERLERSVYDEFAVSPAEIQMVEAHGTGTRLGDPIEFQALTRAFRAHTDKVGYCALGSIKTNLGHCATAAGVAGVIKILLSLKHRAIPPSLHYQRGNSHIAFDGSPFVVNTALKEWAVEDGVKRRAAVSSFGFSGTNAHLVIEEAPAVERHHDDKPGYLIVLSARNADQLRRQVENLATYCRQASTLDCGDLSFTLLLGRKHFDHRLACIARDGDELVATLKAWLATATAPHIHTGVCKDKTRSEYSSLQRHGDKCIENCRNADSAADYLDDLAAIAALYVQGYGLNFADLFEGDTYRRRSLPSYPFARECYWVAEKKVAAPAMPRAVEGSEFDRVVLAPVWRVGAAARGAGVLPGAGRHVVLLCEVGGDASELAAHLAGARCIEVAASGDVAERYGVYAERLLTELQ